MPETGQQWHEQPDYRTSETQEQTIGQAQTHCDAGDLEEGVWLAMRGFLIAHAYQSPRQMNRVRDVVRQVYAGDRGPLDWQPRHAM